MKGGALAVVALSYREQEPMAAEDAASRLGPVLRGWQRYQIFAESVKTDLRFVRNSTANDFLEKVLSSCRERKLTIPERRIFWRARRGCEFELVDRI
jgi:hypothetical protein